MQFAALCLLYAIKHPDSRILSVRGTQNKISESSLQTLKDVIYMMGIEQYFIITENTLRCVNGSEFLFYGAKSYHSFKSLQGINLCWVDEATELSEAAWNMLTPTVRADESRFLISFNPEKEDDWVYENFVLKTHPNAAVIKLNIADNPYFPSVLKEELEDDKLRNYLKYLHIWEGELIKNVEGALWNIDLIKNTNTIPKDFDKIVVAVDPSVTDKITSDACGLIVAAKDADLYYILDDSSSIMSPQTWAEKAVKLYHKYDADHIVAESNQGGDLISTVIHSIDSSIRVVLVHASRGKIARAEPILALYEQKLVWHYNSFKDLETEMLYFTGSKTDKSPNHLDAMVWALTDLSAVVHAPNGARKSSMKLLHI